MTASSRPRWERIWAGSPPPTFGRPTPSLKAAPRSARSCWKASETPDRESAMKVLYTTQATSTGGRTGHSKTADGILDLDLVTPKELGGPGNPSGGKGTKPEQLFGCGYSACFLGAIKFVAGQEKLKVSDATSVTATVGIG